MIWNSYETVNQWDEPQYDKLQPIAILKQKRILYEIETKRIVWTTIVCRQTADHVISFIVLINDYETTNNSR